MKHIRQISWIRYLPFRYSRFFNYIGSFFNYGVREEMTRLAVRFVSDNKVKGDYLEFGVFEGSSFISAFHFAQGMGLKSMKFYAFDSFQGLPSVKETDTELYNKGDWSCTLSEFKKLIRNRRVDLNKVRIVKGWFDETLNEETKSRLPIKSANIVYIDCDLYESTVPVLDFITDYLINGTIIIFDDWFCFKGNPNRGEQRAFKEWMEKHPEITIVQFRKFGWSGNSFIVGEKRKKIEGEGCI